MTARELSHIFKNDWVGKLTMTHWNGKDVRRLIVHLGLP